MLHILFRIFVFHYKKAPHLYFLSHYKEKRAMVNIFGEATTTRSGNSRPGKRGLPGKDGAPGKDGKRG